MHTNRTKWTPAYAAVLVVPLLLGACGGAGTRRAAHHTPTRAAHKDTEPEVVTPHDPGVGSSKISGLTSVERAALREKALTLLLSAAQGGSPEERANALESLVSTPARLSGVAGLALQDQNIGVRSVAAMAVGKAQLANLVPRVQSLLKDGSPFVRGAAIFALKRCNVPVDASPLAAMLFDSNTRLRAHAAFLLGELGERSALPMLREAHREATAHANPSDLRLSDMQLAEARIKLGDEDALSDIRAALYPAKPEDLEAAVLAVQLVGQIRDTASTNRLIELTGIKDPNGQELPGEMRMAAAASLAKLGQPLGSYIARDYFQGGRETLRAQAANLLGETDGRENLQLVSRLMADPDGRVRVAAAAAVVKLTERPAE